MKVIKIKGYEFNELSNNAKTEVRHWLDLTFEPCEYEKEDGSMGYDYYSDMNNDDLQEHCEVNEYLFTEYGKPIHHLKNY